MGFELQARERGKSESLTWAFTAETADVGQVRGLRPAALRNLLGDVNIRNYLSQAQLNQEYPTEAVFNEWLRKAKAEGSFYEKYDHRPVLVQWRPTLIAETGPKHTTFRTTMAVKKGDWKRRRETIELFTSGPSLVDVRLPRDGHLLHGWVGRRLCSVWGACWTNTATWDFSPGLEPSDEMPCEPRTPFGKGASQLARLLKAAGCKPEIVKFVLEGGLECPGCADRRRPPSRLPSATPRVYDFNVVVGCEVLFLRV